jgi:hypothetical protein
MERSLRGGSVLSMDSHVVSAYTPIRPEVSGKPKACLPTVERDLHASHLRKWGLRVYLAVYTTPLDLSTVDI